MIQKIQAFVCRNRETKPEILIFEHDITKIHQLIRGTVKDKEDLKHAVLREIKEESGLENVSVIKKLGEKILNIQAGPTRSGPIEQQLHHAFLVKTLGSTKNQWTHIAEGSVEESGLKFHFYWAPIDENLENIIFDDFKPFLPKLRKELLKNH